MAFYTNPILIAAAIIPAIWLLRNVYQADVLEKEPGGLLLSLVLRGVVATFLALLTERIAAAFCTCFLRKIRLSLIS